MIFVSTRILLMLPLWDTIVKSINNKIIIFLLPYCQSLIFPVFLPCHFFLPLTYIASLSLFISHSLILLPLYHMNPHTHLIFSSRPICSALFSSVDEFKPILPCPCIVMLSELHKLHFHLNNKRAFLIVSRRLCRKKVSATSGTRTVTIQCSSSTWL